MALRQCTVNVHVRALELRQLVRCDADLLTAESRLRNPIPLRFAVTPCRAHKHARPSKPTELSTQCCCWKRRFSGGSPTVLLCLFYSPCSLPPSEQRSALQRVGFVAVQQQLPLQPVDLGTERGTCNYNATCNMQRATLSLGRSNFRAAVATVRPGRPARRRATEATHRVGTCAPGGACVSAGP
jgi:hypothetical protein